MKLIRHFKVICTQCSDEHSVEDIRVLDVEEDYMGRDVCFFECPVTLQVAKSNVYGEQ